MLPLFTRGKLTQTPKHSVLKVLTLEEALNLQFPLEQVLIDLASTPIPADFETLSHLKVAGVIVRKLPTEQTNLPIFHSLEAPEVVGPGDVIRIQDDGRLYVLYRRGANANSLFVTERCNNLCLMCSQPPNPHNDDWRVDEIMEIIPLIDPEQGSLGITGGEPTLLGGNLVKIIEKVALHLPQTSLHILSNGRLFTNPEFSNQFSIAAQRVLWAIPLYADTAFRHDYVVQAKNAFDETLNGIYNLAERGHRIEIRYVVHAQTVGRIEKFSEFVYRNLPFVDHVAFMGLEPMGFAKANKETLWIDPVNYADTLTQACWYLNDRGIVSSIYNVPLCLLPQAAWPLARKSISDWKNLFPEECQACEVRNDCCGLFASADLSWRSKHIRPLVLSRESL